MPLMSGVLEALGDRQAAPREVLGAPAAAIALEARGDFEQPLGRIRAPVENHVFAHLAQLRPDLLVNRQLPGVDDAHVHAGGDRVVEEHGVHRFAYRIVAAERERDVADAAAHQRVGSCALMRRVASMKATP